MIDLTPVPHEEAIAMLKGKPAVLRQTFDAMLPEIRARAFTISQVENLKVLQEVRNRIADLPAGADWATVRKDVAMSISPHLADASDPEDKEKQLSAAFRRAELLLRTHGYQAYEAASYNAMVATQKAFPFWQYQTMEDGAVRPEHAALNGIVLPADSPFWRDHYPPWDWGCRCTVVALSPEDVDEIREQDARRNPEDRMVLEGAQRRRLEQDGELTRGPIKLIDPNDPDRRRVTGKLAGGKFDVRSPSIKGASNARTGAKRSVFLWEPGRLSMPASELSARYDPNLFRGFARAMQSADMIDEEGVRRNVWDWLLAPDRDKAIGKIRMLGRISRVEHVVAIDYDTGARVATRAGEASRVSARSLIARARSDGRRIALIHNHPADGMISPADVAVLARDADVVAEVSSVGGWHLSTVSAGGEIKPMPLLAKRLDGLNRDMKAGVVSEGDWRRELKRIRHVHGIRFVEEPS